MQTDIFFDDVFGSRELTAGPHSLELVYYHYYVDSRLELSAAKGNLSTFTNDFKLVGDSTPGALQTGGLSQFIQTNLAAAMRGVNTSAYLRYPFTVANPADVGSLTLSVDYQDGFFAYLNGQLIGSVNAPLTPQFNSEAVVDRPLSTIKLDATNWRSLFRSGSNVLAFHGLTSDPLATQFFIRPKLTARVAGTEQLLSFSHPTPGAGNNTAGPVLSEFVAVNDVTLADDDGDTPDWLEVFNPGAVDLNLAGWHLTDDPANLDKWTFPSAIVPAGGYLVVAIERP